MQKLVAIIGIVLAVAVIGLFFFTPWVVDYVGAGGDASDGFGLQIVTALGNQMNLEYLVYLLLPIGAFVLVMQIFFDAFIWEQNHFLMALAAILLIVSPIYFLVNFLALPELDPVLELGSKWDFMQQTFWINFAIAGITTVLGLVYAFFDWRESVQRGR